MDIRFICKTKVILIIASINVMKKGGDSEFTIIIGPSKSVLVYALHRKLHLENVLGLAFLPKLL